MVLLNLRWIFQTWDGPFQAWQGPSETVKKVFYFFVNSGPFEKIVGQIRLVFDFGWEYVRAPGSFPPLTKILRPPLVPSK